jgi:hypothetical protein
MTALLEFCLQYERTDLTRYIECAIELVTLLQSLNPLHTRSTRLLFDFDLVLKLLKTQQPKRKKNAFKGYVERMALEGENCQFRALVVYHCHEYVPGLAIKPPSLVNPPES